MSTYGRLQQQALGIAFILAPLLLVLGAAVYLLGIERSADGTSSWVEGIFMALGFLLMIPVHQALARTLGERAPRLGIFCAAAALGLGITIPSTHRLLQRDLVLAGIEESVWRIANQHAGYAPLFIVMGIGMLSVVVLGIGLLWKGGVPRLSALLLALAPILLLVGQGGDDTIAWWQVNIFYPLACLTWFLALAPIGWGYLADTQGAVTRAKGAVTA